MSTITLDDRGVVLTCAHCGQKNRTPFARLSETGQCGRCGTALPPPGEPIAITRDEDFTRLTAQSVLPVLVDFWAEWCGPCHMVAPELVKLANLEHGRLIVAKVNTEELPDVSARFQIRSIPALLLFSGGQVVGQTLGAQPVTALQQFVRDRLATRS